MKTALIVLLLLSLLPYAFAWISGFYRRQQLGTIDNKNPRQQYTQLSGPGARQSLHNKMPGKRWAFTVLLY